MGSPGRAACWASPLPSARTVEDQALTEQIRDLDAGSRGTYGAPAGPRRAAPRARHAGWSQAGGQADAHCWHRGRPPAPDRLWADLTRQRTDQGWLYLAVVLDCCSRQIVGWSMADHLRTELVLDALDMAISRPPAWCITPITAARTPAWCSAGG
jgi:putative transposase